MISHDDALDLATDEIDFFLTPREALDLEEHLDNCRDCKSYSDMLHEDADMLKGFNWDDDPDDGDDDEFGDDPTGAPRFDSRATESDELEDDDEDATPGGSGPYDGPSGPQDRDDEEPDESRRGSADDDDDQDDDEDQIKPLRKEEDEPADDGQDDHDQDMPEPAEPDEDEAGDEPAQDEIAAEQAEPRSDEDLAEQAEPEYGGDPDDDGFFFPTCAADGVEKAAEENGAGGGGAKEAERMVRMGESMKDDELGRVAVYKNTRGILERHRGYWDYYNRDQRGSGAASAAIRNAILRSRTGHTGVDKHQAHGRLDGKNLYRLAMGDHKIFSRRRAPDSGKFLIWVLVDCSSSMSDAEIHQASMVAKALADASSGAPTTRLAVWGWSWPFLSDHQYSGGAMAGVAKVWETGMPTDSVNQLTSLKMGGTPDALVVSWAWKAMLREARSDETPVIVLASDGFGDHRLPQVVDKARRKGVLVKSVSMAGVVSAQKQEQIFGRGNFVPWQGSIDEMARPLGTMIAKMAQGE